jgi:acylphosphatase
MSNLCPSPKFAFRLCASIISPCYLQPLRNLAKAKNTDHKEVLKIQLRGDLNTEISYVFEIYRQAVMGKLAGYVEKQAIGRIEVVVSGEGSAVDHFILWLKNFAGRNTIIDIEEKNIQINYNEFRIISTDKIR